MPRSANNARAPIFFCILISTLLTLTHYSLGSVPATPLMSGLTFPWCHKWYSLGITIDTRLVSQLILAWYQYLGTLLILPNFLLTFSFASIFVVYNFKIYIYYIISSSPYRIFSIIFPIPYSLDTVHNTPLVLCMTFPWRHLWHSPGVISDTLLASQLILPWHQSPSYPSWSVFFYFHIFEVHHFIYIFHYSYT